MSIQLVRRPFTTTEYHKMIEAGILTEDDRVELIDGEIVEMSPIGPRHAACVNRLNSILSRVIGSTYIISIQNPIALDDSSEPEPDLAILKSRSDFYAQSRATAADALVVIEVSDTTLEKDRKMKLPAYARSGIPEFWLVDLIDDRIEIHTQPNSGVYQRIQIVLRGQEVASQVIPQLVLKADDILG